MFSCQLFHSSLIPAWCPNTTCGPPSNFCPCGSSIIQSRAAQSPLCKYQVWIMHLSERTLINKSMPVFDINLSFVLGNKRQFDLFSLAQKKQRKKTEVHQMARSDATSKPRDHKLDQFWGSANQEEQYFLSPHYNVNKWNAQWTVSGECIMKANLHHASTGIVHDTSQHAKLRVHEMRATNIHNRT